MQTLWTILCMEAGPLMDKHSLLVMGWAQLAYTRTKLLHTNMKQRESNNSSSTISKETLQILLRR